MDGHGPRCASCGYDLSGLDSEPVAPVCPECGEAHDPERPYLRPPWPSALAIGAALCLPCIAFVAVVCAAERLPRPAGKIAEELATVGSLAAPLVVVAAPVILARRLASRHAHPSELGIIWGGLAMAGVAGNLLIVFLGAVVRGVV